MSASQPVHIIRLRGPWEYEPLERLAPPGAPLPPAGRVDLPADWSATLGVDFRGRVRYVRRFGRPTNLAPAQAVYLVCVRVDVLGAAWLNGRLLGHIEPQCAGARFEISADLLERNELAIEVVLPVLAEAQERLLRPDRAGLAGGLVGEVRLEIESAE